MAIPAGDSRASRPELVRTACSLLSGERRGTKPGCRRGTSAVDVDRLALLLPRRSAAANLLGATHICGQSYNNPQTSDGQIKPIEGKRLFVSHLPWHSARMGGHLFIIDGDLTKIACDAILIPTDDVFSITQHWEQFLRDAGHWDEISSLKSDPEASWADSAMVPLERRGDTPQIWLGKIGGAGDDSDFKAFTAKIDEFINAALRRYRVSGQQKRIYQWDKPRLALPVIGTDHGGGSAKKGDLIFGLVGKLGALARDTELDTDIVLVTFGEKPYAAAQRARRMVLGNDSEEAIRAHWQFDNEPNDGNLVQSARMLAEDAIKSQLVLFLGAGVSAGAGLPNWTELLAKIAEKVEFGPRHRLKDVEERDQATILQRQLELQEESLGQTVATYLTDTHYSLADGLLASLPSREAVTTNYDQLFEAAWSTGGRSVAVLPNEAAQPRERWLLKLHGCVTRPDKIILTRADYLDMPRQHGALMGLVQGLLMMRHMMFVGYSMRDEDFHELVYEVRHALGEQSKATPIGTVLTLETDPLTNELWTKDLRIVAMTSGATTMSLERRSRQLEMFLDLVGYLSTTSAAFFLDRTYNAVSNDEEDLRDDLSRLFWTVQNAKDDSVKRKVLQFLEEELGADAKYTHNDGI
jgi:hypothetical protein